MTTQPKALWLADELLEYVLKCAGSEHWETVEDAAAELRRLHALNQELLLALSRIGGRCDVEPAYKIARAAIAKAGENT